MSRVSVIVLCLLTLCSAGALAAEPDSPVVVVSGHGEVHVMPDRAKLVMRVQANASNAATAGANCARLAKAVNDALLAAGLAPAELKLTRLSVDPHWEYEGRRRRTGFDAVHTFRIETARLDQVGAWIDAALGAGATEIDDPEFGLADPDASRQEALGRAVASARRDAETIARAAGGALGDLLSVGSGASGRDGGRLDEITVTASRRSGSPGVPTAIVAGEITITETVSARWTFVPARH